MCVFVRFLFMAGVIVAMLAVRVSPMAVFMPLLAAVGVGMFVLMMVGMDMVVFMVMRVGQFPMPVGMLMLMVMRVFMVMRVGVFSVHGGLLVKKWGAQRLYLSNSMLRVPLSTRCHGYFFSVRPTQLI